MVPFVVESLGGITKTGQTLLNSVILACSEHQSLWSPQQLRRELYGSLSIAIQRGNALALTSGYHWNITSTNIMQQPRPSAPVSGEQTSSEFLFSCKDRIMYP